MQLLRQETNGGRNAPVEVADVAQEVLDNAPPLVRVIRSMMRGHRLQELSVPQFRAMALLNYSPHASLSSVADFIGSSLPAASRMIDGLVAKKLVIREEGAVDRRQVSLALTSRGRTALTEAREATRRQLAEKLQILTQSQRKCVMEAMHVLGDIFGRDGVPRHEQMATKQDPGRDESDEPVNSSPTGREAVAALRESGNGIKPVKRDRRK